MKKLLALLVIAVLGAWGADRLGLITIPFLSGDGAQTAQERPRIFGGRRAQKGAEVVPVLTATLVRQDVPVTIDAVGTVQALNTVVVRAQVEGRLMELGFREGQDVKTGDVLARIDPRTYQAQVESAEADLANATANLELQKVQAQRTAELARMKATNRSPDDRPPAALDAGASEAEVAADGSVQVLFDPPAYAAATPAYAADYAQAADHRMDGFAVAGV